MTFYVSIDGQPSFIFDAWTCMPVRCILHETLASTLSIKRVKLQNWIRKCAVARRSSSLVSSWFEFLRSEKCIQAAAAACHEQRLQHLRFRLRGIPTCLVLLAHLPTGLVCMMMSCRVSWRSRNLEAKYTVSLCANTGKRCFLPSKVSGVTISLC